MIKKKNIATTDESVKTDPIENIIQTYANHSSICRIENMLIKQISFLSVRSTYHKWKKRLTI